VCERERERERESIQRERVELYRNKPHEKSQRALYYLYTTSALNPKPKLNPKGSLLLL
jgi:hypothetical protein